MLTDFTIAAGHLCETAITLNKTSQIPPEICHLTKAFSVHHESLLGAGTNWQGMWVVVRNIWASLSSVK